MELKEVFEPIVNFLKNFQRKDKEAISKDKAKERLQLVLMQDRASVSPDFFEMMKKEIIEVIKKYIEIDEESLEVQLTRGFEGDESSGPALYANIPIKNIKPVAKKMKKANEEKEAEGVSAEEIANNIIEDIKQVSEEKTKQIDEKNKKIDKKENKVEEAKEEIKEEVKDKKENVDETAQNAKEEIEETTKENIDEIKEDVDETTDEKESNGAFKEKFNNMKNGVSETFSKVKNQAKDGIKKIKSKAKAKN